MSQASDDLKDILKTKVQHHKTLTLDKLRDDNGKLSNELDDGLTEIEDFYDFFKDYITRSLHDSIDEEKKFQKSIQQKLKKLQLFISDKTRTCVTKRLNILGFPSEKYRCADEILDAHVNKDRSSISEAFESLEMPKNSRVLQKIRVLQNLLDFADHTLTTAKKTITDSPFSKSCIEAFTSMTECHACGSNEPFQKYRSCPSFCSNVMRGCSAELFYYQPKWSKIVKMIEPNNNEELINNLNRFQILLKEIHVVIIEQAKSLRNQCPELVINIQQKCNPKLVRRSKRWIDYTDDDYDVSNKLQIFYDYPN